MKFSKFIVIPVIIAALAALLQVVDQLIGSTAYFAGLNGFGWLSFQAWALYFLAGCTVKGAVRTFFVRKCFLVDKTNQAQERLSLAVVRRRREK